MFLALLIQAGLVFANDLSSWLSFTPTNENLAELSAQLASTGHVHIRNFLSPSSVAAFLEEVRPAWREPKSSSSSVFQDHGNSSFPSNHPRNFLLSGRVAFAPRSAIESACPDTDCRSSRLLTLYNSESLLKLWRDIIAGLPERRSIFFSTDRSGSVYGYRILPGEVTEGQWHFDEHAFSCVMVLQRPSGGGQMSHAKFAQAWANKGNPDWEGWPKIGKILRNESLDDPVIHTVRANVGDVYCFFGVEELHGIADSQGADPRTVTVFAYSDKETFAHSKYVDGNNQWKEEHKEL